MRQLPLTAVSVACFFTALTLVIDASAQQATVTKDPQAISIVQKALDSMGGVQALLAYQDSVTSGTVTVYGGKTPIGYPITLKSKGTQETRIEVQMSKGTNIRIMNKGRAVIQRPDGVVRSLDYDNTQVERVSHIPLLSLLAEYQNNNISVQYQGAAQLGSQTSDVVAVTALPSSSSGSSSIDTALTQTVFFVNTGTGLVDKIQYFERAENGSERKYKIEVLLSNYKTVQSISVPMRQTMYTDGRLDSDIVFESVSFNVGLGDSEFVLPSTGVADAN